MLAWIYTPFYKNDSSNNEDVCLECLQKLPTQVLPNQINVGYLPPITDSRTKVEKLFGIIYKSLDIMNGLDI